MIRPRAPYADHVRRSPTCPPHWRWARARALAALPRRRSLWDDDPPTLAAAAFLRTRAAGFETGSLDPSLGAAVAVFEENGPTRWLVEANLLAGLSAAAVAAKLGHDPSVVSTYHDLFLDVGGALEAAGWIVAHTIGPGPHTGFASDDLANLWRWVGYTHRERMLDRVVAVTTGGGRERYAVEDLEEAELVVEVARLSPGRSQKQILQLHLRRLVDAAGRHPSTYHTPQLRASGADEPLPGVGAGDQGTAELGHVKDPSHNASARGSGWTGGGWERRQRGGAYFYRTVRIGGKPRRIYLGAGGIGRIHELLDRREKRTAEAARVARTQAVARLAEADRLAAEIWAWGRAVARASLVGAGMYCHHGEWRKVVGRPRTRHRRSAPDGPDLSHDPRGWLEATTRRAQAGDRTALAALREALGERSGLWGEVEELSRRAAGCWRGLAAEATGLTGEEFAIAATVWEAGLAGADPVPVERTLAETAVVFRLAATHAQALIDGAQPPAWAGRVGPRRRATAIRRMRAVLGLLGLVQAAGARRPISGVGPAVPFDIPGDRRRVG